MRRNALIRLQLLQVPIRIFFRQQHAPWQSAGPVSSHAKDPRENPMISAQPYEEQGYWFDRYNKDPSKVFDWYLVRFADVWSQIASFLAAEDLQIALELGSGNSTYADDFQSIVPVVVASDYALNAMRVKYQRNRSLECCCLDATRAPFRDNSFDLVLDKATLDSIDCVGDDNVTIAVCRNSWRMLRSGGWMISVSCRGLARRLESFQSLRDIELVSYQKLVLDHGDKGPNNLCVIMLRKVPGHMLPDAASIVKIASAFTVQRSPQSVPPATKRSSADRTDEVCEENVLALSAEALAALQSILHEQLGENEIAVTDFNSMRRAFLRERTGGDDEGNEDEDDNDGVEEIG